MPKLLVDTQNRSTLYALFSRIFLQEADVKLLEHIKEDGALSALFLHLEEWEAFKTIPLPKLIEEHLNADFANISLLHLIPYESFYTREDQMIESGGDNPVVSIYNAYDFRVELEKARVVSPDHIGVELEFMHRLAEAQKKALLENDREAACRIAQIQLDFLQEHLLEWAPMYFINVKLEAKTPLYHDGAEAALEFLLSDHAYLCDLVKECGIKHG